MADNLNVLFHLELTHDAHFTSGFFPWPPCSQAEEGRKCVTRATRGRFWWAPESLPALAMQRVPAVNLSWESSQGPEAERIVPHGP